MKRIITLTAVLGFFTFSTKAQFGDLLNKITKKDSSANNIVNSIGKKVSGNSKPGLSNDDIVSGLKEALRVGTDSSAKKLSKVDGYFKDQAIKILMPPEAKKVESTLRSVGLGSYVDKAILSMNRAAENAAGNVGQIFWNSIK